MDKHIPTEVARYFWDHLPTRSWRSLDALCHAHEEHPEHFDRNQVMDLSRVAGDMVRANEPFPATFEEFARVVEARAEQVPHL